MQYKPQQALALAGLSQEQLRHWKTVLSPLRDFDGRKGGFTVEQIVALSIINRIASGLNVQIAALAPHADEIFAGVARHLREGRPELLVIAGSAGGPQRCLFVDSLKDVDADTLLVVRLGQVTAAALAGATRIEDGQPPLL